MLGATTTACASTALSEGDETGDNTHAFLIESTQIIDIIDKDIAPEDEAYLIIKYQIENLQSQDDSPRRWTDNIKLEAKDEYYDPTFIDSLDNQLWETSLLKYEKKAGYIAFTVPEDILDFKLTFTFPTSETEVIYALHAEDKIISAHVDWVFRKLETLENNRKIPLIGEHVATFHPIKYQGVILVPSEEVSQFMEQTRGLSENAKRAVIEDYLIAHGHCRLD